MEDYAPLADECCICHAKVAPSPGTGRVGKWNIMKAEREGWFFQKDGTCWCPKHVPEWVEEWRAKRRVPEEDG